MIGMLLLCVVLLVLPTLLFWAVVLLVMYWTHDGNIHD